MTPCQSCRTLALKGTGSICEDCQIENLAVIQAMREYLHVSIEVDSLKANRRRKALILEVEHERMVRMGLEAPNAAE